MPVSVVIPLFNEEPNVAPLVAELGALQPALPGLEVVLVDDGSADRTWAQIANAQAGAPFVRGLRLPAHAGQSGALRAGLLAAGGDILVTMDGDLQNDPRDIPRLLAELETCDVVFGYRCPRRDPWRRRIASRIANRLRRCFTGDGVRDAGCGLKAFRRECLADLPATPGMHRLMAAYFHRAGRAIREVPVAHRPRQHGSSKYTNLARLPPALCELVRCLAGRKRK
jgi:dolichol-phosphate mannosyltransferase